MWTLNSGIILAQWAMSMCQFPETMQMPMCKLTVGSTKQHNPQLEKVAVAIYCMLPDAAPVVLGFNYEAYNAPAYIQHIHDLLWIRWPWFPLRYGYSGDWWTFTMWPWPLTLWPWAHAVYRMLHDQTLYQILAKSNTLLPSDSDIKIENLWAVLHHGYHRWISVIELPSRTHNAPIYQISPKSDYLRLRYFGGVPNGSILRSEYDQTTANLARTAEFIDRMKVISEQLHARKQQD